MSRQNMKSAAVPGKTKSSGSAVNLSKSMSTKQAKSRSGVLPSPNKGKSRSRMHFTGTYAEGEERGYTYRKSSAEPNIADLQALLSPTPSEIRNGLSNLWTGLNRRTTMTRRKYSMSVAAKTTHSRSEAADSKSGRRTSGAMRQVVNDVLSLRIKEQPRETDDADSTTSSKLSGQSKQSRRHKQQKHLSEASSKETFKSGTTSGRSSPGSSRRSDKEGSDKQKKHLSAAEKDGEQFPGVKGEEDEETEGGKRKHRRHSAFDEDEEQQGKRKHRRRDSTEDDAETEGGKRKHRKHTSLDEDEEQQGKRKHRRRDSTALDEDEEQQGKRKHKRRDSTDTDDLDSVKRKHKKGEIYEDEDETDSVKRKHKKGIYEDADDELPGSRKGHKEIGSAESLYDKDSFQNLHKRKSKRRPSSTESLTDLVESQQRRKGKTRTSESPQVGDESRQSAKGSPLDKDRSRGVQGKKKRKHDSSEGLDEYEDSSSGSSEESSSEESSIGSSEESIEKKDSKEKKQQVKERRPSQQTSQQSQVKKKIKTSTTKRDVPNADTYKEPKRFLLPEIPGVEYNRAKFHGWDFGTKREETQAENLPDVTDTAADVIESLLNKPRQSMYDLLFKSRANSNYKIKAKGQEGREAPVKPPNALRTYPGFYAVSKPIYQLFQGRKQRLKKEAAGAVEQTTVPPTSILETTSMPQKTLLPPIARLEVSSLPLPSQYSHETMPAFPETGAALSKPPSLEELVLEESAKSSSTIDSVTSEHPAETLNGKLPTPYEKQPKKQKGPKSGSTVKPIAKDIQDVALPTKHGKSIKETPVSKEVYEITADGVSSSVTSADGIPRSDISADVKSPLDISKILGKLPLTQTALPSQDSVPEDQHQMFTTGLPFIAVSSDPSAKIPFFTQDNLSKEGQEMGIFEKPPSSVPKSSEKPSKEKSHSKGFDSQELFDINEGGIPPSDISADRKPSSDALKSPKEAPLLDEPDFTHGKTVLLLPPNIREPKFVTPSATLSDLDYAKVTAKRSSTQFGSWDESISSSGSRELEIQAASGKHDSFQEEDILEFRTTGRRPWEGAELDEDELADGLEVLLNMQGPCANFFNVTRPDLVSLNYAARQGIEELLSFLMYAVVMNRPQNPVDFIIDLMRNIRRMMAIKQDSAVRIQEDIAYRVCKGTVSASAPFSGMSYATEMDILGQTINPVMAASHEISAVGPRGGLPIDKFWNSKTHKRKYSG